MINKTNFLKLYENLLSGPDQPAKDFIISSYSYGMVYKLASGIKNFFADNYTDKTLCLCTDNKAFITASLVASIAGGPSVLLPHSYSVKAIEEIKNTIGFDFLFTDMPEKIQGNIKLILPDQIIKSDKPLTINRDADSLFLKLFTGGSTGKPKVWHKTPRNIISEAIYHTDALNINQSDIILSTAPPQHIYGLLFSVLMPFVSGAGVTDKVCILPQEIILKIKEYSATVLISIPMHYRALKGRTFTLPSLRFALSSGGNLAFEDAKYFHDQTGLEILEIFGSTETGGIATKFNSGVDSPWKLMDNMDWKIISERLCVRSDFISPDIPKDSDNFFITEDRVEKIDGCSLRHLGRTDRVIKVAGKRVDLEEVENILKKIPGINDAAVISVPVASGRKNEIAAIIEGNINQSYIRRSAIRMLESYAVPRKIKIVDKIPVLSSGKYDRREIDIILSSQ